MRKNQKFTIFEEGKIKKPKEGASEKLHTICAIHQVLAYELDKLLDDSCSEKERILMMVDMVYDMGKRMGNKLRDYHKDNKLPGGWRNNL